MVVPWPPVSKTPVVDDKGLSANLYSVGRANLSPSSATIPAFAIPVLVVSCVVLALCVAVIICVLTKVLFFSKFSTLVSIITLVACGLLGAACVAGIVLSSLAMRSPTAIGLAQRYQMDQQPIFEIPVRVRIGDKHFGTVYKRFTYVKDQRGRYRAIQVADPPTPSSVSVNAVAGDSSSNRPSGATTTTKKKKSTTKKPSTGRSSDVSVPPVNVPLTGTVHVGSDGLLHIDQWDSPSQQRALVGNPTSFEGDRILAVYLVSLSGDNPCGSDQVPQPCYATCDPSDMTNMLFQGSKSVAAFYRSASNGKFRLQPNNPMFIPITLDGTTRVLDMPKVMQEKGLLAQGASYHALYLPQNYQRDLFAQGAAGLGMVGGSFSWMVNCMWSVFGHEWGHNLGLVMSFFFSAFPPFSLFF